MKDTEWPTFGDNHHPWPRQLLYRIVEADPEAEEEKIVERLRRKLHKRKDFLDAVIEEYVAHNINYILRSVTGRSSWERFQDALSREDQRKKPRKKRKQEGAEATEKGAA